MTAWNCNFIWLYIRQIRGSAEAVSNHRIWHFLHTALIFQILFSNYRATFRTDLHNFRLNNLSTMHCITTCQLVNHLYSCRKTAEPTAPGKLPYTAGGSQVIEAHFRAKFDLHLLAHTYTPLYTHQYLRHHVA